MEDETLTLTVLQDRFGICRLDTCEVPPRWAIESPFFCVTRTKEELSVVCVEASIPEGITSNKGWRCLKVSGPLGLSLTGVLSSLTVLLAKADISVFVLSTYDTDYLLVKESNLEKAKATLSAVGHNVLD